MGTYAKGRFALMRGASEGLTKESLANWRFRFADLHSSKCRLPGLLRITFPVAVTLKRLATDLRVLLRGVVFGMGKGEDDSNGPG
jgi:hypothetical protein